MLKSGILPHFKHTVLGFTFSMLSMIAGTKCYFYCKNNKIHKINNNEVWGCLCLTMFLNTDYKENN